MGNIVNRKEIAETMEREHAAGKSIILAIGSFDVFHVGHLRYLRASKALGDTLVAAVRDDEEVRRIKGEGRPIVPFEDRIEIVAAMEPVDFAAGVNERTIEDLIRSVRPNICAFGSDSELDLFPLKILLSAIGCKSVIVGGPKIYSSTEFIYLLSRSG